jgi:hypothetical protein
MALPSLVRIPLNLTTSLLTGGVKLLLRPLHRGGDGQDQAAAPTPTPAAGRTPQSQPQDADVPATNPTAGQDQPARANDEEHAVGRRSHERREPTPEPAQGATAAQAGSRRASTPKAGRAVRKRTTKADTLDTVATGAGRGRGGTPEAPAENTPKARAKAGQGREPAPMGSSDAEGGEGA